MTNEERGWRGEAAFMRVLNDLRLKFTCIDQRPETQSREFRRARAKRHDVSVQLPDGRWVLVDVKNKVRCTLSHDELTRAQCAARIHGSPWIFAFVVDGVFELVGASRAAQLCANASFNRAKAGFVEVPRSERRRLEYVDNLVCVAEHEAARVLR